MQKSPNPFTKTEACPLPVISLSRLIDSFLLAGEISEHSDRTLSSRRCRLAQFVWFLNYKEIEQIGTDEIRRFFLYLGRGHEEEGGRWQGKWSNVKALKPVSSGTVKSYHSTLRTFFRWLVTEGELGVNPMDRIPPPVDRPDQIQPFTDDQLRRLEKAAKRPQKNKGERRGSPARDEAIFLLMLDTGIRESELAGLQIRDVDFLSRIIRIREGKGGKERTVPFCGDTKRAIFAYLREREAADTDPLFLSQRGQDAEAGLSRWGLIHLVQRWCKEAGIQGVRCSPHTFRHTFAISFLRSGGDVFTLQTILGHTSLAMTNKYVALAKADISRQHAKNSPVSRLRGKTR